MDRILQHAQAWDRLTEHARHLIAQSAGAEAADVTGMVRVSVSARGLVTEVMVDERWRSMLPVAAVADAVVQAAAAAGAHRLASMVTPGEQAPTRASASAAGEFRHADPQGALNASAQLLSVARRAAAAMRGRSQDGSVEQAVEVVGASRQGHVRVTMAGFGVRSVVMDRRWLAQTGHRQLSQELTEAAVAASTCPVTVMLDTDSGGAVTELRDLVADPASLFARLGLPATDEGNRR